MKVELGSLHMNANDSVVAHTVTHLTITERSLHYVFLHLCRSSSGEDDERLELAAKLLGQRIVVRGSTHFDWDDTYGHVTSVWTQSDLLTPMLRLLGNLVDVSRVFEEALIAPDFHWRSTS